MVRNFSLVKLVDSGAEGVKASIKVRFLAVLVIPLLVVQANHYILSFRLGPFLKTKIHILNYFEIIN